jgi:hypothetical protein
VRISAARQTLRLAKLAKRSEITPSELREMKIPFPLPRKSLKNWAQSESQERKGWVTMKN